MPCDELEAHVGLRQSLVHFRRQSCPLTVKHDDTRGLKSTDSHVAIELEIPFAVLHKIEQNLDDGFSVSNALPLKHGAVLRIKTFQHSDRCRLAVAVDKAAI